MKPPLIGLSVIALCVAVIAYLVPEEEVPRPMWFFVFLMLVASAIFCWSHPKAPKSPSAWLPYIGVAAAIGVAFASIDGFLHPSAEPGVSFLQSVVQNPRIIFDLSLAVAGGIVAISGWARSLAQGKTDA